MTIKPPPDTITLHTSLLFDPLTKRFLTDISLTVRPSTGLITSVHQRTHPLSTSVPPPDIDLRNHTVIPGLVDAHTHIFLHGYSQASALYQTRDESLVERIIRATNHCRTALLAGYTTYRDLGTESAGECDVHVRNAINRGLIPGPRIFCVTETLASSGGYAIRHENALGGLVAPRLSDPCDGPAAVRAGVRRRLAAGADLIKFYADYRKRALRWPQPVCPGGPEIQFPPPSHIVDSTSFPGRNPSLPLFTQTEMDAIVAESRAARAPVAAHASSAQAVEMAARAGVTSVEHGFEPWTHTPALALFQQNKTIFVPTLAVAAAETDPATLKPVLQQVKTAFDAGVDIAAGGDTGAFPHGENARELDLLLEAGLPVEEVLCAATVNGWKACGGDWAGRRFGSFEVGCAADVVALDGDVRVQREGERAAWWRVKFVMKDARVWKRDGVPVGMV